MLKFAPLHAALRPPILSAPGADETHIALDHIPHLGSFVDPEEPMTRPIRMIRGSSFCPHSTYLTECQRTKQMKPERIKLLNFLANLPTPLLKV